MVEGLGDHVVNRMSSTSYYSGGGRKDRVTERGVDKLPKVPQVYSVLQGRESVIPEVQHRRETPLVGTDPTRTRKKERSTERLGRDRVRPTVCGGRDY